MDTKKALTEEQQASIRDKCSEEIEQAVKYILKKHGIDNKFFLLFFINYVSESDPGITAIETDVTVNGGLSVEEYAVMSKEILRTLLDRYEEPR